MKNLVIDDYTALYPPDHEGEVRISIVDDQGVFVSKYVPFEVLETWVASIREQIITSLNKQAKCVNSKCMSIPGQDFCSECGEYMPPVG